MPYPRLPEKWTRVLEGAGRGLYPADDLTALIQRLRIPSNNEAMHRIYKLAEEFDLPVMAAQ